MDVERILKNVNYALQQEGNKVVNPILQHIDGLAQEERFTVFSMCEIATWFSETQININELIAVHNDQAKNHYMEKEIICSAFGEYVFDIVTQPLQSMNWEKYLIRLRINNC